ncbi:hypothetical protein DL93DRAFT_2070047 [Clavulina sp. PMI_390]|nr:hypothetical protein DL93DRAFT_2070047 [Clavulina sp. PMI_390]
MTNPSDSTGTPSRPVETENKVDAADPTPRTESVATPATDAVVTAPPTTDDDAPVKAPAAVAAAADDEKPSSSSPASDAVADSPAAPAAATEAAPATEPAAPEPEPVDPSQVTLPDEDAAELAWHKQTMLAEEDIREKVTIPSAFAAKYLWSPFVAATTEESTRLPGAHPINHVTIPPALLADAHAALSSALSSSTQLAAVHPKPPPPPEPSSSTTKDEPAPTSTDPPPEPEVLTEPIITFFCPYDNTALVIDTIVSGVGQSQRADVIVLDALMLSQGEAGPLGPGMSFISPKFLFPRELTNGASPSRPGEVLQGTLSSE